MTTLGAGEVGGMDIGKSTGNPVLRRMIKRPKSGSGHPADSQRDLRSRQAALFSRKTFTICPDSLRGPGNPASLAAMRAVIQRVLEASVTVAGESISSIGPGLLVLLGVEDGDSADDRTWLSGKIARMRIFSDEEGKMNRSVIEAAGDILIVSQFTLHASTKKGNRPSFLKSAPPSVSEPHYLKFCKEIETETGKSVGRGIFGADMKVALVNDGPVTILIDSRARE